MHIYQKLQEKCREKGVQDFEACKSANIDKSYKSKWKSSFENGEEDYPISANIAKKLGEYFGCSPSYFLGIGFGEEEKKLLVNDDEELTAYLELLRTRPECRALLSTAAGASKKEVEENVRFIEAIRNAKKSD